MIAESDATGAVIREYIWLGTLPVALVDYSGGTAILYFVHAEHLGAPQKVSDASKVVVWSGQFEPFGEVEGVTGALTQLLMFPGQYYDSETGTAQNWHRQYDARTGRYLEADPLGLGGGANLYAYVGGNPVNVTDPTGECPWCAAILVGAVAGAGIDAVIQLADNGGRLDCLDWRSIGTSALIGGALGGLGEAAIVGRAAERVGIAAKNGTTIAGYTKHGINRAIGNSAGRTGTKASAILDALKSPQKIVSGVDSAGRPFTVYTGASARVVANPVTGKIVSVNPLSGRGVR